MNIEYNIKQNIIIPIQTFLYVLPQVIPQWFSHNTATG